jgi:uncharacterized PurR-regulated membrane protein YhhQ (DUF165 family)
MRYINTISYLLLIFLVNFLFPILPMCTVFGQSFSTADVLVGVVYILRDFAQREVGGKILYVMIVGCVLSYLLADKLISIASICSFAVGETIDWGFFTYTRKPFSQRLLTSSAISVPADSLVFLYLINQLNLAGFLVMSTAKILGVFSIWLYWNRRQHYLTAAQQAA